MALLALILALAFPASAADVADLPQVPETPVVPAAPVLPALPVLPTPIAELSVPNPVSATTAIQSGANALFIDAAAAERGQISAVVKAADAAAGGARIVSVIGRFQDSRDVTLKPKLDEGLRGAVLERAESVKDVLRFLRRAYLPPLGERSVGPSDVTAYLTRADDFIAHNNERFRAGIQIATPRGAANAATLLKAKARGLRFVELGAALSPADQAAVRAAAAAAGVSVVESVRTDRAAVASAFERYADVPADPAKDAQTLQLGFLMSPDPVMARELSERAGGLWVDAEDGQFSPEAVGRVLAAAAPGKPKVVRAVEWNDPHIADYVAAGATGIVAPQVSQAWQARAFVAAVKRANPRAMAVVMIETRRGLSNVEEIASVPGIDVLFIGPNDLALSLGAKQGGAEFNAAVARIEAAARAAGVPLGGLSKSRSETYAEHARGYRLVTTVSDQKALAGYLRKR